MAKPNWNDRTPRVRIAYVGNPEQGEDTFKIVTGNDAFWLLPHSHHPARREISAAEVCELERMGTVVTEQQAA